ncbi:MAG: alkaline phosphatase family protein [Candidatus Krumholzibacteria bacterium]|nr:alkaline phosphatase family protein [Candidatus Krumholzibacteria bacterium]
MKLISITLAVLALCALSSCNNSAEIGAAAQPVQAGSKLVVFVIDGPRATELWDDTTHAQMPHMWNDLRPQGTLFTNFRNDGLTLTNPGHASIMTGTWQTVDNQGNTRPDRPTLFEYYRAATGAPMSDTWVVSGKSKLYVCSHGTDPDYGAVYGASERVGFATDMAVYDALMDVLADEKPHVVLACFPQVDLKGHSGVWQDYLDAIANVDSLLWKTWNSLQADPFYEGQTTLLVTADHGRHDDAHGGFQHHGDDCEGCRRLFCLALGPDVRQGETVALVYDQRDVCSTCGEVLEVPVPKAEGRVMEDMFEVPTGVREKPAR